MLTHYCSTSIQFIKTNSIHYRGLIISLETTSFSYTYSFFLLILLAIITSYKPFEWTASLAFCIQTHCQQCHLWKALCVRDCPCLDVCLARKIINAKMFKHHIHPLRDSAASFRWHTCMFGMTWLMSLSGHRGSGGKPFYEKQAISPLKQCIAFVYVNFHRARARCITAKSLQLRTASCLRSMEQEEIRPFLRSQLPFHTTINRWWYGLMKDGMYRTYKQCIHTSKLRKRLDPWIKENKRS